MHVDTTCGQCPVGVFKELSERHACRWNREDGRLSSRGQLYKWSQTGRFNSKHRLPQFGGPKVPSGSGGALLQAQMAAVSSCPPVVTLVTSLVALERRSSHHMAPTPLTSRLLPETPPHATAVELGVQHTNLGGHTLQQETGRVGWDRPLKPGFTCHGGLGLPTPQVRNARPSG
ncbi:hypothetical protein HJG60_010741 [Phyllostomus discolor]|uniref:Uncharacterized protein n=1 Tax=Phyllostomus discolor TaxID=89673 RepID=A0A834EA27_9CHIR|nr:hypothetical protein HJG60_010741 [Phyllostomus discolor]